MGVIDDLSYGQTRKLVDHPTPLDEYADTEGFKRVSASLSEIKTVLAVFDTCFYDQDPSNYRQDWKDEDNVGVRMYREIRRDELDMLVEVAESVYGVNFDRGDVNIVSSIHAFFVQQEAKGEYAAYSLVVWHPETSERTII